MNLVSKPGVLASRGVSATKRAFPTTPSADRYFASETAEHARRRVVACLERGDGPALVIGVPGSGKSTLLEVVADDVAGALRVVRLGTTQFCTRRALLQAILFGLGQPHRDREEGELRLSLSAALMDASVSGGGVALLVDEAQSIPTRLLEELRLLANTVVSGEPRLRLVLAATPALEETLASPELATLNQRIAARCYLGPMTRDETARYVRAQVAAAGGDPDALFHRDAYAAIYLASDGVPRLVNQVCDRALVMAVEVGASTIDAPAIQAAWSDLHQLPAPWDAPKASAPAEAAASIEFGALPELDGASPSPPDRRSAAATQAAAGSPYDEDHLLDELATELDDLDELVLPAIRVADPPAADRGGVFQAVRAIDGPASARGAASPSAEYAPFEPAQFEPAQIAEYDADDDGPVAYSFPTRLGDAPGGDGPPEMDPADEDQPLAADPFAEPFDEEEVVLDRFADLESVIPVGSPAVVNRLDPALARAFEKFSPAVESLVEDVIGRLESPPRAAGFSVVAAAPAEEDGRVGVRESAAVESVVCLDGVGEDEGLLIIEDDAPAAASGEAHRSEYGQLFASLRRG